VPLPAFNILPEFQLFGEDFFIRSVYGLGTFFEGTPRSRRLADLRRSPRC
jgi:hypothetical protein